MGNRWFAVAYSLFIAPEGVYAIRTGPGWRMQVRGRYRNERLVEDVLGVEAALDPSNLVGELSARNGSLLVTAASLSQVVLSRRRDSYRIFASAMPDIYVNTLFLRLR